MKTWRIIETLIADVQSKANEENPFINTNARLIENTSNYNVIAPEHSLTTDLMMLCTFDTDMVNNGSIIFNESSPYPILSNGNPMLAGSILKNMETLLIFNGSGWNIIGGGGISADDVINAINNKIFVASDTTAAVWTKNGDEYESKVTITGIKDTDNIIFQVDENQSLSILASGIYCKAIENSMLTLAARRDPMAAVKFNYIILR